MNVRVALLIGTALLAASASAQELKPVRTITVTGQADRHVVPDEAHVNVQVSALNVKLSVAKAEHDEKLRKVIDIAKNAGIDEAQIKTQSSNMQPEYSYENNKRSFKGYKVSTGLDLTVKKTESVANLLEKLTAAGLENDADNQWGNLLSVNYTIGDPDKLRESMATDAIKNAHDKAERMAAAAGASLGAVYQINEGATPNFNYFRPVPMMAMARNATAAAPVAPPAGEQEVNASVTVSYELKN